MALRILPFRQYIEQDVINLYSLDTTGLDTALADPSVDGGNAAGALVEVTVGDFDKGIEYTNDTYLGKTDYPHIGGNGYPKVTGMQVKPHDGTGAALGFTLRQTLTHDENGEKLLYYRQKLIETQAVLPGEVVPVLTRGLLTLDSSAVDGAAPTVGASVFAAAGGKIAAAGTVKVGTCIATGSRKAGLTADQFAGESGSSSAYFLIKVEL
jgi:hypothetical protein